VGPLHPMSPAPTPSVSSGTAVAAAPASPPAAARLQSLDAYRGLIMVSLAFGGFGLAATARNHLKTDPDSGFWRAVGHQFEHAEWLGCSYWDLIQPSFMFMVGVSMAYSYVKRQSEGQSWARMFGHACWRALILVALGIFLTSNSRPSTDWSLMNVLCQIGLGYPFLFLLWRRTLRTQAIVAAGLLAGTWALYTVAAGPGIDPANGAPQVGVPAAWAREHLSGIGAAWHKNANVGHTVDTWLLNLLPRREPFVFNSGGYQTINFIPALVTMLFGLMGGELLRSGRSARDKLLWLFGAGAAGLVLGLAWQALGCPLVKRLWTPSWALFSTGWCCVILGALYAVVDVRGWRAWSFPLVVVGMNSIAIYSMGMLLKGWTARTLQTHLRADLFKILGPANAPFVQSTLVGLVFWLVCWWMYRRRIFLRI
jgi:heparan-alpha-glucosaminide N-acetyltransferase